MRRKIRVWSAAGSNPKRGGGVTGYQDSQIRDGSPPLISELVKRLPEMVGRIFNAPVGQRSYVTKNDYTPLLIATKKKIADFYEAAETDDLANPNVRRAYDELKKEIRNQY